MKIKLLLQSSGFLALGWISVFGQSANVPVTAVDAKTKEGTAALPAAAQLRSDLTSQILSGEIKPEEAIKQLREATSATGLKIDADADFAFGATDIGLRLLAARNPAAAEPFFQAAEISLGQAIARTPDSTKQEKIQYLQARASIRADYLNKRTDAQTDFDAALKLSPDSKQLQQLRSRLGADPASAIQNHQVLPTRG